MKKATAILLSSAILLSLLSGCGKSSEVSSTPSVSSSTTSDSSSPMESETNTSTATPASSDTQPVSLLFKKATGFSREWKDGKYIVNGLDYSGNKICGITDSDGNATLVDGYTALYPLADGHLLATTDENAVGECAFTGRTLNLCTVGFAGVILDESGNVIYQPDESLGYERLYPINSHLILSIRAKTNFDGNTATLSVLNQNGEFLYDCTSDDFNLVDYMTFDDDGFVWTLSPLYNFSDEFPVSFGPDDNLGENRIVKLGLYCGGYGGFGCIYFGDDDFYSEYHSEQEYYHQSADSRFAIYNSQNFINGGFTTDVDTGEYNYLPRITYFWDATDFATLNSLQEDMVNDSSCLPYSSRIFFGGSDSDGMGYFKRTIYRDEGETYSGPFFSFFDATGREIPIPQNYLDSLDSSRILEHDFLLIMSGQNHTTYCTLVNPSDGSSIEPFLIPNSPSPSCAAQNDSILALGYSGSIRLYSTENGELIDSVDFDGTGTNVSSIFFSGDCIVATGKGNDDTTYYHVYSLSNNCPII